MRKTKLLATFLLTAAVFVGCSANNQTGDVQINTGESNTSGTVSVETSTPEPTEEPEQEVNKVLYDKDGLKATFVSFNQDGFYGPEVKLLLENNTDENITVQIRECSINGYMIDPIFSADIASGKKVNDTIDFFGSDLAENNITQVDSIELSLKFFESDSYEDIAVSKPITITFNESGSTAAIPEGVTLYDDKEIKVIYKDLVTDDFGDVNMNVYIENNTDTKLLIQARDCSVNGFMIDPIFSSEIAPGKKINDDLTFMESYLEENNITTFEEVELNLLIMDDTTGDTIAKVPVSLQLK